MSPHEGRTFPASTALVPARGVGAAPMRDALSSGDAREYTTWMRTPPLTKVELSAHIPDGGIHPGRHILRSSHSMTTIEHNALRMFATSILVAAGCPENTASIVGHSLVDSNLAGKDAHGVARLVRYIDDIAEGRIVPTAEPELAWRRLCVALVDGMWAFGQVSAHRAVQLASDIAQSDGTALVAIVRCNHIGRLGQYVEAAIDRGLACLILCNAGGRFPTLAPYGARTPVTATNPVAFGAPIRNRQPVIMDFSTSVLSESEVNLARRKGVPIPTNSLVDVVGRVTTDPNALYDGGALMPFGGHRGYCLALTVEIMAGALTGVGFPGRADYSGGCGVLIFTARLDLFAPAGEVEAILTDLCNAVKAAKPMQGHEQVQLPGERSLRHRRERLEHGIPIHDTVWEELGALASRLGVPLP